MSRPGAMYLSTQCKTYRRGKGIEPGHPEQKDGENGKAVRAEAITERPRGEAAEKGEGGQDPGREPSLRRDPDGYSVGRKRRCVGEREEREQRRAYRPRRRSGEQQIDQHRRSRHPDERSGNPRYRPGRHFGDGFYDEGANGFARATAATFEKHGEAE